MLILSLFLSFNLFADVSIITDFDDTIKITEGSGDITDYLDDDIYTGMPEIFSGTRTYAKSLYVLTASPSVIKARVRQILSRNKIFYKELVLRSNLREGKFEYKVKAITKILKASQDDFILIGDDVGKDPEVFSEIQRLFPDRILNSYVHVVKARTIPMDVTPYWTSFDLALREHLEGRMNEGWVEKIWNKLMLEPKFKYIFPKKADCPTSTDVWEWQMTTVFQPEAFSLGEKLSALCLARQSVIF